MKKYLAIISILVGFAFCASAQSPGTLVVINSGTIVGAATNTSSAFAVSEYDKVGIQVGVKAMGAATSTLKVTTFRSVDSTTYETDAYTTNYVTLNGTTAVNTFIPLDVPCVGTMKVLCENTNASINITNLTVTRRVNAIRTK